MGRGRRAAASPRCGRASDQVAERGAGRGDRRCGGRWDRLPAGAPGQRPSAAGAARRRPGSSTGHGSRRCRPGTRRAAHRSGAEGSTRPPLHRPSRPGRVSPRPQASRRRQAIPAESPRTRARRSAGGRAIAPACADLRPGADLLAAAPARRVPLRALAALLEVGRSQSKSRLRLGAQVTIEVLGGGEDVDPHSSRPPQPLADQPP